MNRLAHESSPYLLQHKDNPVDWYPWGEEALARAKAENKPILLSIGYSACHWCHVMEHESFENPEIAKRMNEQFVNIKVDREERPDLDHIYQNVAQAITRGGGWPLTVFLTPDLKPYFGGTYFPPEDRYGRPGFPRVLDGIARAYREDPAGVAENAEKLTAFIRGMDRAPSDAPDAPRGAAELRSLADLSADALRMASGFDPLHGGIHGAPKFPHPLLLSFFARVRPLVADPGDRARVSSALHLTLERMASNGLFDHLGGGFHRYSVDDRWAVPHFEKMLYDNGLLLRAYGEALALEPVATGTDASPEAADVRFGLEARRALYVHTIEATVAYLEREMRSPEGAFYATQDADSEGEEGRFFVWTPKDLEGLATQGAVSDEEARAFALRFGVDDAGNFEHGATVLFLSRSAREVASLMGVADVRARELIDASTRKIFEARARRVAPATDRKILASWNGLAISGLCWAAKGLVAADPVSSRETAVRDAGRATADRALRLAREAFDAIASRLGRPGGRLYSTLQEGKPKLNAYLDDYAFMAMAALDLSRIAIAGGEGDGDSAGGSRSGAGTGANPDFSSARYIAQAREWVDVILTQFSDAQDAPGYFFTSADHEALIHRPKNTFDQAIPSGASVALSVMLALGDLLEDGARYAREAESQLSRLGPLLSRAPLGLGELACAALLAARGPVTLQGAGAVDLCRQPHVFYKPGGDTQLQLCRRGTCLRPKSLDEALRWVDEQDVF